MSGLWVRERGSSRPRRHVGGRGGCFGRRRGAVPRCEPLEPRALLAAAPVAAGAEFRVNSQSAGSQELFSEAPHAVAADADGDFVVTWSSSGQDGSGWGVYARRYGADGTARGAEFRVNQVTANNQWYPNVAVDAGGNFVVAWASDLQDGGGSGVFARRYTAAGAPAGDEFRVNTTTAGDQRHPTVSMDADGDFVVAWSGYQQAGGAGWDVYARRYSAAGAAQGAEFRVNGTTAGNQQYAALAADDSGDFVVTWTTDGQDGSGSAVYARRYSAAGAAQGSEFRVNTTTAGNQQFSRVAADADGDFVVAWASAGQDGSGRGVYAQRYSAAGAKRGGEFRLNEVTAGEQFAPTVASDDAGGFVVTWTTAAQDGALFGVYARAYDAAGVSRGGEFRVNTYTAGNQVYSAAASDADGDLVIVWQSEGQDGSFFGVYGQRYAAPDVVAPTADVVDVTPDPRSTPVGSVSIVFSEPVVGFDLADISLTRNGGANPLGVAQTLATTDGGRTWTLGNLSALTTATGTYQVLVRASGGGVTDVAGNALAADAADTWQVVPPPDTTPPTADVIDVTPDPRLDAVASISVRFSEPVTGFGLSDLRLTRDGAATNLLTPAQTLTTTDNRTFTLGNLSALTAQVGTYTVRLVAAGSGIVDSAGNALAADAADSWAVVPPPDTTPPTADVVDVSPDPAAGPVDSITVRFSERVTGFDRADLRLMLGGTPANLLTAAQTLTSTDGRTYTLANLAALTAAPGTYTLTLVAAGSGIVDLAGNALAADASDTWTLLPAPARVVGRYVFYNASGFDSADAAANAADDAAIATDKAALLPGQAATFANYTSFSRGINGVMVDVAGAAPAPWSATDFATRATTRLDASGGSAGAVWTAGPAPRSVHVRPGAGVDGSDRITLLWADGEIVREWLEVTLLATAATRLAAPDVFYFGSAPGDTGNRAGSAAVDGADLLLTRAAMRGAAPAVTSRFDHDRSGTIDARDLAIVRAAVSQPALGLAGPVSVSAAERTAVRGAYRPATAAVLSPATEDDAALAPRPGAVQ